MPPARKPIGDRFWPKIVRRGPDECWEWQAAKSTRGYGKLGAPGTDAGCEYAHRVSWELHNGPIPDGMHVLHHCDNRICVNPQHLFLGTNLDNILDMRAKGRDYKFTDADRQKAYALR